ncbi:MazG-like family protein [Acrocarpospora catenulata]|uniref:MazG-like family protein n=1 Tax=Acrocarpospora catenulata TaxID=2836182 RepID=UPI001BDA3955|nr:MazG-like family protein [Acrocarpospora catenulata]
MPEQTTAPAESMPPGRLAEIEATIPDGQFGDHWTFTPGEDANRKGIWVVLDDDNQVIATVPMGDGDPDPGADLADFLAGARTAVPELAAEVRRLNGVVGFLGRELQRDAQKTVDAVRAEAAAESCDHSFPCQPPHGSVFNPGPCRHCGLPYLVAQGIDEMEEARRALGDHAALRHRAHSGDLAACGEQPCTAIRAALQGHAPAPSLGRHVAALVAWLDSHNPRTDHEIACRVMKTAGEAGEAIETYLAAVGQNPRKKGTGTLDHVRDELLDVAATALVAAASLEPGRAEHTIDADLLAHLAYLCDRVGAGETR